MRRQYLRIAPDAGKLRLMPDANTSTASICNDASRPLRLTGAALELCRDAEARLKLTNLAVERGKDLFGAKGVDDLAEKLGYTRLAFYRLRSGRDCRISLEEAVELAKKLNMPFTRAFERAA